MKLLRLSAGLLTLLAFVPLADARVLTPAQQATLTRSRRALRANVRMAAQKRAQRFQSVIPLTALYENKDLGVSIRHPESWSVRELLEEEDSLILVMMLLGPQKDGVRPNANLVLEGLEDASLSLDEYTKLGLEKLNYLFANFHLLSSNPAVIAGRTGHRVEFTADLEGVSLKYTQYWFIRRGTAYVFTFADRPETFSTNAATFEQMFETLMVK